MAEETEKKLSVIMAQAIEKRMSNVHTCMPGKIQTYDAATQTATVIPQFIRTYSNGDVVALPVISKVPVMFPRTKSAWIKLPVKPGDSVMLHFAERSIERWLDKNEPVDPQSGNRFDINDAIAVPGFFAFGDAIEPLEAEGCLEIANGGGRLAVDDEGKFSLENSAGELLKQIQDLADAIIGGGATATGNPGPIPFDAATIAAAQAVKDTVGNMKK